MNISIPGDLFCGIQLFIYFKTIYWENTFSFFKQKSINIALVTEQTTVAFYWKPIGFI